MLLGRSRVMTSRPGNSLLDQLPVVDVGKCTRPMPQLNVNDVGIPVVMDPREITHTFRMCCAEQWLHRHEDLALTVTFIDDLKILYASCDRMPLVRYGNREGYVVLVIRPERIPANHDRVCMILSSDDPDEFRPVLIRYQGMMQENHRFPFFQ